MEPQVNEVKDEHKLIMRFIDIKATDARKKSFIITQTGKSQN